MSLSDLAALIEQEAALAKRIDAELASWSDPNLNPSRPGYTAIRAAITMADGGRLSLRGMAKELGFSPTYLSQCATGGCIPSRRLMLRMHKRFGMGAAKGGQ